MASKPKAPAKRAPSAGEIKVDVNIKRLGSKLTKTQRDLLKARISGKVLAWAKRDVGEAPLPVVTCNEHGPPHGGGRLSMVDEEETSGA